MFFFLFIFSFYYFLCLLSTSKKKKQKTCSKRIQYFTQHTIVLFVIWLLPYFIFHTYAIHFRVIWMRCIELLFYICIFLTLCSSLRFLSFSIKVKVSEGKNGSHRSTGWIPCELLGYGLKNIYTILLWCDYYKWRTHMFAPQPLHLR